MKKFLLILVLLLSVSSSWAYDVCIDGIYYNIISKANIAEVTSGDEEYSGSVIIPSTIEYKGVSYSVSNIGADAFWKCTNLNSITIPNSVVSIGNRAFDICMGLNSVKISSLEAWCKIKFDDDDSANPLFYAKNLYLNGEKITNLVIPSSVTSLEDFAFSGGNFTTITIPNNVTSIGKHTFWGCENLTSITIPNSITDIGDGAFRGCARLSSITIPTNVKEIGREAFGGCISLKNITIPNSVKEIRFGTFWGCSALTSLILGNGIEFISEMAFAACKKLEIVTCYANKAPNSHLEAFKDSYINYCTLIVPEASLNDYKATAPWKEFGTIKTIESTSISEVSNNQPTITSIVGLDGKTNKNLIKGINIIQTYDGKTKKALIK